MSRYNHLQQLLGTRLEADAKANPRTVGTTPAGGTFDIDLARIVPDPDQPRKHFDDAELDNLAGSLKNVGQLEPIRVRYDAEGDRYVIVCGERRYRAAHRAGLQTLLAIVDERRLEADRLTVVQLVENALRVDLSPLEQARAFQQLLTAWSCSQSELAKRLSISDAKVSRALALLQLPTELHSAIAAGEVAPTMAVKQARRKPAAKSGRRVKPVRITTPAGVVVVTPKRGQSVAEVLAAALEQERGRAAA